MGGVPGARWQDDDQLHITLRFVGKVERFVAEDIALALSNVHSPPLELAIAGVSRFEQRGRTTALWAGVVPQDPLVQLHRKIDAALVRIGLSPEGRAYQPHITLARMNAASAAAERFVVDHAALTSPCFTLGHFLLFESRLGTDRASYSTIARYPLTAGL